MTRKYRPAERRFHQTAMRDRLAQYRDEGITRVEIMTAGDFNVCDECAALGGKIFEVDSVPSLPMHEEDEERDICRCIYMAVLE